MNRVNPVSSRAVAQWVMLGVVMLLVQVILGGITRLTGSGLSITEWNVVTGVVPPLNEHQWIQEFTRYRQTEQFSLLHADFQLSDFKFIFFWEWFHRLWARLVGIVFIAGFIYLLIRGALKTSMIKPLLILFLLGGLQGVVGWIMVRSGLVGDAIYVAPVKLAMHFIFALGLIGYAYWFALQLVVPPAAIVRSSPLRRMTWGILAVLSVQLVFGALMAGNKAASAASTWPTINGDWFPRGLFKASPLAANFVDNKITIQFVHRGIAYILFVLVLRWTLLTKRIPNPARSIEKIRWLPMALIAIQVLLGILAVLTSPTIVINHWGMFEWLAQLHQLVALLFLLAMLSMLYLVRAPGLPLKVR